MMDLSLYTSCGLVILITAALSTANLPNPGGDMFPEFDQLTPQEQLGRIEKLDRLVKDNMKLLHQEGANLDSLVEKATKLVNKEKDKESAQYYVDLIKLISEEGTMQVLNDERERLTLILENVGEGAEFDHTMKLRNIIGGFAEAEANYIFSSLPAFGKESFNPEDLNLNVDSKFQPPPDPQPKEPSAEKEDVYYRKKKEDNTKKPTIPEGKGKKPDPVGKNESPDSPKEPENKLDKEDVPSAPVNEKHDPEIPEGKGRDPGEDVEPEGETKPDVPIGQHDDL